MGLYDGGGDGDRLVDQKKVKASALSLNMGDDHPRQRAMHRCVRIYIYIHTHTHIYIYIYIYIYICAYMYVCVRLYVCMCVFI